jgi:uncharacterized membrane protein YkoI
MTIVRSLLLLLVVSSLAVSSSSAADESQRKLLREAKVDRTHAEIIALGRTRDGKVRHGTLVREGGRLVWLFAVDMPNAPTREVRIDAHTGKIVSMRKESEHHGH